METPVVLIIFRRPETTRKVFKVIRQIKPKKLFIIADGPRNDRIGEEKKCELTRCVVDMVDWECEVYKDYSDTNLGCAKRVFSGLNTVFDHVDRAIILEDDCLPNLSFFRFCEETLEKYKCDTRIMSVTGQNVQFGLERSPYSYYFSRFSHCWGWATWKRAWECFDFDMDLWPQVKKDKVLNLVFDSPAEARRWTELLDRTYLGHINSWAYRWSLSCFIQNGLHVIPNRNLVSNIGFGRDSTNTTVSKSKLSNIPSHYMDFPLLHPPYIIRHTEADRYTQRTLHAARGKKARIKRLIRRTIKYFQ